MPKTPTKRNRAAQDSTLINIRALKARVAKLEAQMKNVWKAFRLQRG